MTFTAVEIVTATCSVIQTGLLCVAAIYGFRQVREARRNRQLTAAFPLFNAINSRESVERRRALYLKVPKDASAANTEEKLLVNDVINQLDFLGYLTRVENLELEIVLGLYYGTIIRCWQHSTPYVLEERIVRGTHFAEHFEWIANRALEYQDKRHPFETVQAAK